MEELVKSLTKAQLLRAMYSLSDLGQASSAVQFLLDECDFDQKYNWIELRRFRCYESACIISFCRPFESARSVTTLGLNAFGIRLNQEEQRIKTKIMNLRRKVIAHSDEEEMNYQIFFAELEGDPNPGFPFLKFHENLHLEREEYEALRDLTRKIIDGVTKVVFLKMRDNPGLIDNRKVPASWRKGEA